LRIEDRDLGLKIQPVGDEGILPNVANGAGLTVSNQRVQVQAGSVVAAGIGSGFRSGQEAAGIQPPHPVGG
jgi:hypothetical protein